MQLKRLRNIILLVIILLLTLLSLLDLKTFQKEALASVNVFSNASEQTTKSVSQLTYDMSCQDKLKGNILVKYGRNQSMFNRVKGFRQQIKLNPYSTIQDQYTLVYKALLENNQSSLYQFLSVLKDSLKLKKCNQNDVARIVVELVQNLPYRFIHYNSCNYWTEKDEFHAIPCESNANPLGVLAPYETCFNAYGDCDSKALLAYQMLDFFDIPVNIWWSDVYHHAIIGIAFLDIPILSAKYILKDGRYYYAADLTSRDEIGHINPLYSNLNNWKIIL